MDKFEPNSSSLFILTSIHKRKYVKSRLVKSIRIPGDMLCVVIQGKGLLRLDHDVVSLHPNQTFFLRSSMRVEIMPESGGVEFYIAVIRRGKVVRRTEGWRYDEADTDVPLLPDGKLPIKANRTSLEQFHRLYQLYRNRSMKDNTVQICFQSLIWFLIQGLSEQGDSEEASNGIDRSIDYIYKHFHQKINLDTLSSIAGLTQTSYSRSFKRVKGVSPVQYLHRIRVDHAKKFLQENYSIKEVSRLVGMGNEFYFSRMFKRESGMTPTLYIQRKQLKVAVASCFGFEESLHSLGVSPVASMNAYDIEGQSEADCQMQLQEQLKSLRKARPDLILADYRHLPYYDELKGIASTVVLNFSMDWRSYYNRIADLVGREREARHNFIQVDQKVKYARTILNETMKNETLSLIRIYKDRIRIQGTINHPLNELLYLELGLMAGSNVPVNEQNKEYILEQLPLFETDHLFIYPSVESVEEHWNEMKAFRDNRIRYISNWIGMSWTPSGQSRIIEELLKSYE